MNYEINLNDIKEYNTHQHDLIPSQSALLVIEMQEVFHSDMGLISDKQLHNIKQLTEFAKKNNIEIIYVRHNDSAKNSKHMIEWWGGDKIEYGSAGWQILKDFDTNNHTIIDKSQYSAFFGTNLHELLQAKGITNILISGVMTNCCCETAARDAFMLGYNVSFINDATATINAELHLSTLRNLAFGFAQIINTEDLVNG